MLLLKGGVLLMLTRYRMKPAGGALTYIEKGKEVNESLKKKKKNQKSEIGMHCSTCRSNHAKFIMQESCKKESLETNQC